MNSGLFIWVLTPLFTAVALLCPLYTILNLTLYLKIDISYSVVGVTVRTTNHVYRSGFNYKIYSGPCIAGIIKYIPTRTWRGSATWRARGGHQVTKFRIILIHGRRRYGGSAYRVPDTFADTGHVSRGVRMPSAPGCRQPLEAAIRHW